MFPFVAFPLAALATDLPSAQQAAEACADRVAGWISCEASDSPSALHCVCATSAVPPRVAYTTLVDADTAASAFDGRVLVARDLTDEQSTARVGVWFDALATPDEIRGYWADLVAAYEDALGAGLSSYVAAERAAQAMGPHEVGHALGIHHTYP